MSALRLLLIFTLLASLTACLRQPDHCWICQREIHSRVRVTLSLRDGKAVHACCPRCALHYEEEPDNKVRDIRVTDYASGGSLPFASAYFVEGSDETPCLRHHPVTDESKAPMHVCYDRCMPSLIAFKEESAARAFASDRGGTVYPPGELPGPSAPAGR